MKKTYDNIYKMVSKLDPYAVEHVNKSVCEDFNSGELYISLPDSDNTMYGWWHLGKSNPGPNANPDSLTFRVEYKKEYYEKIKE